MENNVEQYVSVIFENKFYPFMSEKILNDSDFRNKIYGDSTRYTYKTECGLHPGQLVDIIVNDSVKKVLVVEVGINKDKINFPLDKIKNLEIANI